jgi:uncharacterized protein (DUF433 family)
MATAAKIVYSHITKHPGIRGGKACMDQTRICVNNVVFLHKDGKTPEEILVEHPDLNLAQVHAALTYYYDHVDEIEAELAEDEGWEEEHERHKAEYLARHATK